MYPLWYPRRGGRASPGDCSSPNANDNPIINAVDIQYMFCNKYQKLDERVEYYIKYQSTDRNIRVGVKRVSAILAKFKDTLK